MIEQKKMSPIYSFRDLEIWKKGLEITFMVYDLTRTFPKEEIFCLTSQMRRAAISIPSNIAEGRSRRTRKDFCQFLSIALSSTSELETQLLIANKYYPSKNILNTIDLLHEEQRMITGMIKKLKI